MWRRCIQHYWPVHMGCAQHRVLTLTVAATWFLFGLLLYTWYPVVTDHAVQTLHLEWTNETVAFGRLRRKPHMSGIYRVPRGVVWVKSEEDFFTKLKRYNDVIYDLGQDIVKERGKFSPVATHRPLHVIAGNTEYYLVTLAAIPNVTSVFMAWTDSSGLHSNDTRTWTSLKDESNLVIREYHPYTASDSVCSDIRGPKPYTRHRWDTVYNNTCSSQISDAFDTRSIELYFLNAIQIQPKIYWPNHGNRWPEHFYTDVPRYITYLHIIQNAVVNKLGEVHMGKHKTIQNSCKPKFSGDAPQFYMARLPQYQEVFSISQYWGSEFFHKNLEDLPKLAPYVIFLRKNLQVKIHVYNAGSYMEFVIKRLRLDPARMVYGTVAARVLYLPRATSCGFAHIQEGQLFSHYMRLTIPPTESKKTLLLIRRSGSRHFIERSQISEQLRKLAAEFGLNFYVFRDNPLPVFELATLEFNKAKVVVAPHGAGLSNLLFVKPGTFVVEGLCNPPHINMCYSRLSHLLGLRYHGLVSRGGCEGHVDIPAGQIASTIRTVLELLKFRNEL